MKSADFTSHEQPPALREVRDHCLRTGDWQGVPAELRFFFLVGEAQRAERIRKRFGWQGEGHVESWLAFELQRQFPEVSRPLAVLAGTLCQPPALREGPMTYELATAIARAAVDAASRDTWEDLWEAMHDPSRSATAVPLPKDWN
jgi:hypothetical protein